MVKASALAFGQLAESAFDQMADGKNIELNPFGKARHNKDNIGIDIAAFPFPDKAEQKASDEREPHKKEKRLPLFVEGI